MTRMRAPFSSFSLWLSDFSSVKIWGETKTRWDQRGLGGQGDTASSSSTSRGSAAPQSSHKLGERGLEHSTDQGAPGAKQGHSPSSRAGTISELVQPKPVPTG